jgi:hypothetical protein
VKATSGRRPTRSLVTESSEVRSHPRPSTTNDPRQTPSRGLVQM